MGDQAALEKVEAEIQALEAKLEALEAEIKEARAAHDTEEVAALRAARPPRRRGAPGRSTRAPAAA
jgi:multidrug resistance efflux pump